MRPTEGEVEIAALDYEVYQPMAERQLSSLAGQMCQSTRTVRGCASGTVVATQAGKVSFAEIATAHRQEGLAAMGEFIEPDEAECADLETRGGMGETHRS